MNDNRITILPPAMSGVMCISGYRGIGKTFLSSQADLPQNIAFFDFEAKGKGVDASLKFGLYRALTVDATSEGKAHVEPIALFDTMMNAFNGLKKDQFTTVVLDNISPMELAIKAEALRNVDRYCAAFGLNRKNVLAGRYGGTSAVMNFFIAEIVKTLHAKGVQLIVATSHIKRDWVGGVQVPNKFSAKGGDKWQELSILTLMLVPGEHAPVPAGLVQKEQLGVIEIDREPTADEVEQMTRGEIGHTVYRRLPFRVPRCTFQQLRWYLANPADLSDPQPGEVPTEDESRPFATKMSREQFEIVKMAVANEQRQEADTDDAVEAIGAALAADDPNQAVVREMRESGKSVIEISKETGLTVKEVARLAK